MLSWFNRRAKVTFHFGNCLSSCKWMYGEKTRACEKGANKGKWCFWCPDMQYLYTPGSVTDTAILCGCGVNSNYSLSACRSLFAVALQRVGSVQEVWSKNGHRVKYLHNLRDAGNNLGGLELWERWILERQEINDGLYQPRWFCLIKLFFNNRWWHIYDSYDEDDDDKIIDKSKEKSD